MRLSVARQYLQIGGRLSRRHFNGALLLLLAFLLLWLCLPAAAVEAAGPWPPAALLTVIALLSIPRLHDTGLRGIWLLAMLLPVLGPLWLGWRLCARRGMTLENRFGADPEAPSADYLAVK